MNETARGLASIGFGGVYSFPSVGSPASDRSHNPRLRLPPVTAGSYKTHRHGITAVSFAF